MFVLLTIKCWMFAMQLRPRRINCRRRLTPPPPTPLLQPLSIHKISFSSINHFICQMPFRWKIKCPITTQKCYESQKLFKSQLKYTFSWIILAQPPNDKKYSRLTFTSSFPPFLSPCHYGRVEKSGEKARWLELEDFLDTSMLPMLREFFTSQFVFLFCIDFCQHLS